MAEAKTRQPTVMETTGMRKIEQPKEKAPIAHTVQMPSARSVMGQFVKDNGTVTAFSTYQKQIMDRLDMVSSESVKAGNAEALRSLKEANMDNIVFHRMLNSFGPKLNAEVRTELDKMSDELNRAFDKKAEECGLGIKEVKPGHFKETHTNKLLRMEHRRLRSLEHRVENLEEKMFKELTKFTFNRYGIKPQDYAQDMERFTSTMKAMRAAVRVDIKYPTWHPDVRSAKVVGMPGEVSEMPGVLSPRAGVQEHMDTPRVGAEFLSGLNDEELSDISGGMEMMFGESPKIAAKAPKGAKAPRGRQAKINRVTSSSLEGVEVVGVGD